MSSSYRPEVAKVVLTLLMSSTIKQFCSSVVTNELFLLSLRHVEVRPGRCTRIRNSDATKDRLPHPLRPIHWVFPCITASNTHRAGFEPFCSNGLSVRYVAYVCITLTKSLNSWDSRKGKLFITDSLYTFIKSISRTLTLLYNNEYINTVSQSVELVSQAVSQQPIE